MEKVSLSGAWQFRQVGTTEWLPATVPGGVHTDLLALGRIPDPFVADNEKQVMWVAEADWEYRHSFSVPTAALKEARLYLACDGLDTLSEVYLNGALLGRTNNMYRQYRWEAKALLKAKNNEIIIKFPSTVQHITALQNQFELKGVSHAIPGGPYVRKAPCHFGWDWGPMLPPIGVWKDIRLEGYTGARIAEVHLRQQHRDGKVIVSAAVTLERWNDQPVDLTMTLTAPDGTIREVCETINTSITLAEEVTQPQLWWPNGYGAQPLYKVEISAGENGHILDRKHFQLGLRTIELRRQPDEWGESFTFVVNGVPIFAKGSDWIPADSFPTRLTRDWVAGLLKSAVASHQNMLRVWGGGVFEDDTFYDLCDELGILIWQDFTFACSIYPLNDPAFVENLRFEVAENVQRLRHRASLALWCGNNEMEEGWMFWGWNTAAYQPYKAAYDEYFHHTLPAWVKELDPDNAYWPSSPSSNTPFVDVRSNDRGDAHYWEVWHGRKPFTAYRAVYPRFMSEFGFQSLPPLETIQTYARPEDWNMTSYIMEHHQRNASGNGLMIGQMTDTFRMPKDFPSLVYLTMVLQAEGIRYGVEHWRRNKNRVSGTLYWQLNDCWPVASWASLDYYGRWKALHYAAKRFYAPVMLSIFDHDQVMSVHVTSDIGETVTGEVQWQLVTTEGQVLQSGSTSVEVGPYLSKEITAPAFNLNEAETRRTVFVCTLVRGGRVVDTKLALFVPNKHLELANPVLKVHVTATDGQLYFDVSTRALARFVQLSLTGADVVFSDNYFDVPAGWVVQVTAPMPAGWTLDQVKTALRVTSLYDSF